MTATQLPFPIADEIAAMYPDPPPGPVSEEEYIRWSESHGHVRAEWIDGEISFMAPIGPVHDDNGWVIGALLRHFVEKQKLGVVKFDTWTKFQIPRPQLRGPDILFLRTGREDVIGEKNVGEPPDFIIEIVSPGDESRDYRDKFLLYEASKVREYWIVDPASQSIEAYELNSAGKYVRYLEQADKLSSRVAAGFYIRLSWLWSNPKKEVLEALAELEAATQDETRNMKT